MGDRDKNRELREQVERSKRTVERADRAINRLWDRNKKK